jgi:serine/threonine-protein kinase RsbW
MKMTILERDDGITHVVLSGRLDTTGTADIEDVFSAATTARQRPAIVDLSGIDFLASRGIGLLFANGKSLVKIGHKMVLLNPQEMVASVLETSKVDRVLPIANSLNEAIQILTGIAVEPEDAPIPSAGETAPEPTRPASSAATVTEGSLALTIKNELGELEGLNAKLAEFLEAHGVPDRATYAINLAIDELVVNVIRYAYVDDETHLIDVALTIEGEQIILRIVDDGRPFDPRRGPSLDLHAEDRGVGGLGLILVLDMVDLLNYQRVEEKNRVEVRVHLVADEQ